MKQKILDIISDRDPKGYYTLLKKHQAVIDWIFQETNEYAPSSFNERLYIILVNAPPKKPCGKYPLFNSFQKGYRDFCGTKTSCECNQQAHSQKLLEVHSKKTREQKNNTVQKMQETCMHKYGVKNPALDSAVQHKIRETNLKKYNAASPLESETIQQKIKSTNLKNLGVEYPFQNKQIVQKSHRTLRQKYGHDFMKKARDQFLFEHNNQNPFVVYQDRIKETIKQNHNVTHPMQNSEIQRKASQTLVRNHGVHNPAQLHINSDAYEILEDCNKFTNLCQQYSLKELAELLGVSDRLIWARHDRYQLNIYNRSCRSQYEEEIATWLDSLSVSYVRNKKISTKTVDFLIQDSIAVEFNGLYTHSEYSHYGKKLKIDKNYHYNKYMQCKHLNVQLFTIFEDEWNSNKLAIKNKIKLSLGIGDRGIAARKCKINVIDYETAYDFLNQYHLQNCAKSTVYLGSFDSSDQLIGVMSFVKRNNQQWELNRFASDQLVHPGMFSKMLKFFERSYHPKEITSFSDNRWSWGNVYRQNGFCVDQHLKPDYFVTDYHTREHKFNWRKSRIASRFGVDITNKTELQLTLELGRDRIWDCGKIKWIKHVSC